MRGRDLIVSLVLGFGIVSCGSGRGPAGPSGGPPPVVGAVEVDPASGPIGTLFTLTAIGLTEGDVVAFEISFPGQGKAFPGVALTVPEDGMVTTTYRATSANQPGEYLVRLTGPPGRLAEGRFTIVPGGAFRDPEAAVTSTSRSGSGTTRPKSTTKPTLSTTSTTRSKPSTTTNVITSTTAAPPTRAPTTTVTSSSPREVRPGS